MNPFPNLLKMTSRELEDHIKNIANMTVEETDALIRVQILEMLAGLPIMKDTSRDSLMRDFYNIRNVFAFFNVEFEGSDTDSIYDLFGREDPIHNTLNPFLDRYRIGYLLVREG